MKTRQFKTTIGYQERQTETGTPKHLRSAHHSNDLNGRLRKFQGDPRAHSEDRIVAENLEGLRTRFTAEIEKFGWGYGYMGRPERRVLLKNVRMQDSGKLLKDRLWRTCRKWLQGFSAGDVVGFDARLENGKPTRPTNITLIKSAKRANLAPGTGAPAVQMELF